MADENAVLPDISTENLPKLRSGITWDKVFSDKGDVTPMGAAALAHHISSPNYDTILNPQEEQNFQTWKSQYAPNDSGEDYDLRGAFKAGLKPDPQTGHWPDTFKKPNHPTFSNESQYAIDAPRKAGHWEGDRFIPPNNMSQELPLAPDNVPDYIQQRKQMDMLSPKPISDNAPSIQEQYKTLLQNPPQHGDFKESIGRHALDFITGKGIDNQEPYQRAVQDYQMRVGGLHDIINTESSQRTAQAKAELEQAQAARYRNLANIDPYKLAAINHPGKKLSLREQYANILEGLNDPSLEPEQRALLQGKKQSLSDAITLTSNKTKNVVDQVQAKFPQYVAQIPPPKDEQGNIDVEELPAWAQKINALATKDKLQLQRPIAIRVEPVNDEQGNVNGYNVLYSQPGGGIGMQYKNVSEGGSGVSAIPPKPTSQVLSQGQRAASIQPEVQDIYDLIDENKDKIGPGAGLISKGKLALGFKDPSLAKLDDKLDAFVTAFMKAHSVAGVNIKRDLKSHLTLAQDPENLKQRIVGLDDYLKGYMESIGKKAPNVSRSASTTEKIFPENRVQEYAKAKGISVIRARKEIKDAGYKIQ